MSTIAVFGSTGQTGRRIVDRLARDGKDVLAISRRTGGSALGVRTATADPSRTSMSDLRDALTGVDAVVFVPREIRSAWIETAP